MYRPRMSALPSSKLDAYSFSASSTVPLPSMVFLMPRPCATSWNITSSKNASKVTCLSWSLAISWLAIGTRMVSNFAFITFSSCRRRVPFFVVGQVDLDGLAADVRVAAVVDDLVGVEIGIGTGHLSLVLRVNRQALLQCRQEAGEAGELLAPLDVLYQHQAFVRGLVAEQ